MSPVAIRQLVRFLPPHDDPNSDPRNSARRFRPRRCHGSTRSTNASRAPRRRILGRIRRLRLGGGPEPEATYYTAGRADHRIPPPKHLLVRYGPRSDPQRFARCLPPRGRALGSPAAPSSCIPQVRGSPLWTVTGNAICIACHTTNGKTQFDTPYRSQPIDTQSVDTTATEFGIACESCHGPGEAHVRANQNPIRRYELHFSAAPDPTIVQPALLDPERSSQVCAQCHSVWEFYNREGERRANAEGFPYRPGDELRDTRFVAQPMTDLYSPEITAFLKRDPEFVRGSFWSDGMIRVSGREYNGLIDSPCFKNATEVERTLSCFSCHTMHKTPEDTQSVAGWAATHQVTAGMESNNACLQCHETLASNLTAHTRHDADSSGSQCYNCHMPYTTYGLLKALRSHTISNPSASETTETRRPNACNLCHLDQTLAWTAERLNEWYDTPLPQLSEDEERVAASLLWVLRGNAGLRAIVAWNMGWQPAQETSDTSWMVPHLAELLNDPYDAVRYIAYRSLRSLPQFANFEYDFSPTRNSGLKLCCL